MATKLPSDGNHPEGARLFARAKSNIGPDGGGVLYFIKVGPIPDHPDIINTYIEWGGQVDGTAKELLDSAESSGKDKPNMTTKAMGWLRSILKDGPNAAGDIIKQGKKMGFSQNVLFRAKRRLKIKTAKVGYPGSWVWYPPAPEDSAKISIQPASKSSGKKRMQPIDILEDFPKICSLQNLREKTVLGESREAPEDSLGEDPQCPDDATPRNLRSGLIKKDSYAPFSAEDSLARCVEPSPNLGTLDDDEVVL